MHIFQKTILFFTLSIAILPAHSKPIETAEPSFFKRAWSWASNSPCHQEINSNNASPSYDPSKYDKGKLYKLTEELDNEIRSILYKLNIEDPDSIMLAAQFSDKENAFATHINGDRFICIDVEWFLSLTKSEREFLIAHEAMHLHCEHGNKIEEYKSKLKIRKLLLLAATSLPAVYVSRVMYKDLSTYDKSWSPFVAAATLGTLIWGLFGVIIYDHYDRTINKEKQSQEFEADEQAAIQFNSCKGALRSLHRLLKKQLEQKRKLPSGYRLVHRTHPAPKKRIAAIEKLKNERGFDPELQNNPSDELIEALVYGIILNNTTQIEKALNKGADVNTIIDGDHMMAIAIKNHCSLSVIITLVQYGADLNGTDCEGRPIIYLAGLQEDLDVFEFLFNAGADINARCSQSNHSLLWHAILENKIDLLQRVLAAGADPNQELTDSMTPINIATYKESMEMIELLIEYGADLITQRYEDKNGEKLSPHEFALAFGKKDIAQHLFEAILKQAAAIRASYEI